MRTCIGHFPTLYPDEIVYSVFARYRKRARLPNLSAAIRAFYGFLYSVPVELPSHLDILIGNLPEEHPYTADLLIDRHTTFPFYGFFLDEQQRDLVRDTMRKAGGAGVRARLGITAGGLKPQLFLRHCPSCDVENRQIYGETYWHRLHQIAGIYVCPKHQVLLEDTMVPRGIKARNVYVEAESICSLKNPQQLDPRDPAHNLALKMATDAAWLLNNTKQKPDLGSVHRGYDFMLAQNGLAYHTGMVKMELLVAKIIDKYPAEMLRRLDCMMDVQLANHKQWIATLLYSHNRAQSPIKHLLLIDFLGMSVANFTDKLLAGNLQSSRLFGSKHWNCLNPICKDYRAETIQNCSVQNDKRISGRVIGRFKCIRCGFTYSRFGPDPTCYSQLDRGWVNEYGPSWHARLREGWTDENLNIEELARLLGVTRRVIKKQAARWNLPFPKPGRRITKFNGDGLVGWKGKHKPIDSQSISENHSAWLNIIKHTTAKNIQTIIRLHGTVYRFLRKHDPLWLVTHPLRREKIVRAPAVNWSDRDSALVKTIALTVAALKLRLGKPIIISQLAICKEIGSPAGLYNQRSKMPKFAAALKKAAETRPSFTIRTILWAAGEIRRTGNVITKAKIIKLTGQLVRSQWQNPAVRETVMKVCQE